MSERSLSINSRIFVLTLSFCLIAGATALQAQVATAPQFIFPHFVSFSEEGSGIVLFNPNSRAASASLTLRWPDGSMVEASANPVILTIPARSQVIWTAFDLFGADLPVDASLEIRSTTAGLVAYYQTYDPAVTFVDGAAAAEISSKLIFPVVPGTTEGISEIDLANPNPRETAVELKLWSFEGRVLGTATVNLPGGGKYRNLTDYIFPAGTDLRNASHITATAKPRNVLSAAQPVAGTSLFAGFSSNYSADGFLDLAALNAVSLTSTSNTGVIPYFHTGGHDASTLSLVNAEPASVSVTVTAIANNGANLGTRTVSLGAQGGLRAPLQNILTSLGSSEREGWLLIQATGRVAAAMIYGRSDSSSLAAIPMQKTPKLEFVFPLIGQGSGYFTEVTLANPSSRSSNVDIFVIGENGSTLAIGQVVVGASQRASFPLNQPLPEVANQAGGVLYIRSAEGLFASATIWSDTGSIAASYTPQDASFLPAAMTRFAITGRVFVNDAPAAGFPVALTGPVESVATTGEDGAYAFANLAAGRYSIRVARPGFQFIPSLATLDVTTVSLRQDFMAYTDSGSIVVQPSALPIGSPDTTVTIFGNDFSSTSEAFLGGTRMQTTFVDAIRLQAVVPAYLLGSAATYDLVVVTDGYDSSRRVSKPCVFVVYQDRPLLKAILTAGVISEGSAGSTITLQGSGFLQGAIVKVNGSSDGIFASVVNESEIQAYVPARYFEMGGIYPVTVENPYPSNAESNIQLLPVYYAPPAVETVLPSSSPVRLEPGTGPLSIDVLGYGFRRGAIVLFNGTPLPTTYCETGDYCLSVHLFAKVPAELLRRAGFARIEVQNPDPSLPGAQAAYLRIDGLQPTITLVQPGSATLLDSPFKFSMPVVVNGTNFGPETMVRVYQEGADALPAFSASKVEVLSSTQLLIFVQMEFPASLGEWRVEVANPPPGGGTTEASSFLIGDGSFVANPFLISLSPQTVPAGSPSFTLTINGTNFVAGTVINFNYAALPTTVVSDRQVMAVVPAALIRSAGRISISVTNPDSGGTSNRLFLDIQ